MALIHHLVLLAILPVYFYFIFSFGDRAHVNICFRVNREHLRATESVNTNDVYRCSRTFAIRWRWSFQKKKKEGIKCV